MTLLKVNGVPVRLLIIKIDSFNNKNALNDYKKSLKRLKKTNKTGNNNNSFGGRNKKVILPLNLF